MDQIDKIIKDYKKIVEKSFNRKDYNSTIAAVNSLSLFLYEYNQYYKDDYLEEYTVKLSDILKDEINISNFKKTKTVVFYDGFSIKSRGLAPMYINGLIKNDYKVVYVVKKENKEYVNYLHETYGNKLIIEEIYYTKNGNFAFAKELTNTLLKYSPQAAFFYTTPYDAGACAAFGVFDKLIDRYLIDLTDHAFWLGVRSNDFFIGSRNMAASNLVHHRGVKKEQFIKNEVNLIINNVKDDNPLPFDIYKEKYVFSGGALYKTFGDDNDTFYKIIEHILDKYQDIKYLYAGYGNPGKINQIVSKYPGRAFYVNERTDFYEIIAHSIIYLNTYPICGGLMMKYAANANVIPVTLRCDEDMDELLLDQEKRKIIYNTYDELISDLDKLLENEEYRKEREKLLDGAVVSEPRFLKNIKNIIEHQPTDFDVDFTLIDTTSFIARYKDRFNCKKIIQKTLSKANLCILKYKPSLIFPLIKKIIKRII